MSVMVVYKKESDHARPVIDFLRDFKAQTGREIEEVDPESREGMARCSLYDIVEYPSVIALSYDGELQSLWRGLPLPTINDVSYYA